MNPEFISRIYFEWMSRVVTKDTVNEDIYTNLLQELYETPFIFVVPMDENRYNDGINLRSEFAYETNKDPEIIFEALETRPCTVLEMMIALTIRINNIMDDIEVGDRFKSWFWGMVDNLGLYGMTNERYSSEFVDLVISKFLNRQYRNEGAGSLFPNAHNLPNYNQIQIWDQAMHYLNQHI